MLTRRLPAWPVVALMAGLTLLTGCSPGPAPAPTLREPKVTVVPVMHSNAGRLPLQEYAFVPAQVRLVDQARLTLIDRCMRQFGFRYQLTLPEQPDSGDDLGRRYGLMDAKVAAERGYQVSQPKNAKRPKLTANQKIAVFGSEKPSNIKGITVPKGGCLDEAIRALDARTPPGADVDLGQKMLFASFKRSQQDSRVKQVFSTWSRCMSRSGYHYSDPLKPFADPALHQRPRTGIPVAEADVRCKDSTNLIGVWFAVESAYQQHMIAEQADGLRKTKQALDARLRIAATLTA
jgi:hypothetical protein